MEAEDFLAATSLGPTTAPNIRKLIKLKPTTLALMHGSAFRGDTVGAIDALADCFEARLQAANDALTPNSADARLPESGGPKLSDFAPLLGAKQT